jgi:hypothetical protein
MVIFSLENLHLFYFPFRVSLPSHSSCILCIIKDTNQQKHHEAFYKNERRGV